MQDRLFILAMAAGFGVLHGQLLSHLHFYAGIWALACFGLFLKISSSRWRFVLLWMALFFGAFKLASTHSNWVKNHPPLEPLDRFACGALLYTGSSALLNVDQVADRKSGLRDVDFLSHWRSPEPLPEAGRRVCVDLQVSRQNLSHGSWYVEIVGVERGEVIHSRNSVADFRFALEISLKRIFEGFPRVQSFLRLALFQSKDPELKGMKSDFRLLGLSHVLVASGFHVGLAGGLLAFLASLCGAGFGTRCLAYCFGTGFLLLVAGPGPSLARAAMFAPLMFAGRGMKRSLNSLRILGLIFLIHLLILPGDILSIGSVLSYSATLYLCVVPNLLYSRGLRGGKILGWLLLPVFMALVSIYLGLGFSPLGILGSLLAPALTPVLIWGMGALILGMLMEGPLIFLHSWIMPLPEFLLGMLETTASRFPEMQMRDPLEGALWLAGILLLGGFWLEKPAPRGVPGSGMLDRFVSWSLEQRSMSPRVLSRELSHLVGGDEEEALHQAIRRQGGGYDALWLVGPWQRRLGVQVLSPLSRKIQQVCSSWPLALPERFEANPALRAFFQEKKLPEVDLVRMEFVMARLLEEYEDTSRREVQSFLRDNGLSEEWVGEIHSLLRELLREHVPWLQHSQIHASTLLNCRVNWKRLDEIDAGLQELLNREA